MTNSTQHREYIEFIDKFEMLSPYELDHLSKIVHQYFQAAVPAPHEGINISITQADMKEILIRSMQAAQLDLAERKLKDAEYNLQMVKSRMYQK